MLKTARSYLHEFVRTQYPYRNVTDWRTDRRLSGLRNTTVKSDFRPEVEIRPFHACALQCTRP